MLFLPSLLTAQIPQDKQLHFAAGATIGSMTYLVSNSFKDVSNAESICLAGFTVTLAGATKEAFDYKPDMMDFVYTEIGGAAGIMATHYLTRRYFNKMSFYFDTKHISDKRYNYIGIVKRF